MRKTLETNKCLMYIKYKHTFDKPRTEVRTYEKTG